MSDYRLLIPALTFWIVRIGWINPIQVITIISLLAILLAYFAFVNFREKYFAVTLIGIILAAIIAIIVNAISPVPENKFKSSAWQIKNFESDLASDGFFTNLAKGLVFSVHENFQNVINNFSPEIAGILNGVILGDESLIPDSLSNQVKLSGLQHLVAISGAHISLLIGIAIFFLGRRNRRITFIIAVIFLFSLILLVGLSASVLRAAIMGVIALFALVLGRGSGAISALSLGVIIAAAFYPELARGIGFQMSVFTTAAIVIFAIPLSALSGISQNFWLKILIVPLVAGTAVIPISAQIQSELSIFSVLANVLVAPVIPLITVLGLVAAIFSSLFPIIAYVLLVPCAICAWWVVQIAYLVSSIEILNLSPWVIAVIQTMALISIIFGASITEKKKTFRIDFAASKNQRKNTVTIFIGSILIGVILSVFFVPHLFPANANLIWEIIQCDVGQGSALLARSSGKTVLIDVGSERNSASSCLTRNNVKQLDLVIISHLDADHSAGLAQVLRKAKVGKIWLSENENPTHRYKLIISLAEKYEIPVEKVRAEKRYENWLEILSPAKLKGGKDDTNADSLVVALKLKNLRVLVLADVPEEIQNNLATTKLGEFSCVIVAHHGAKSQSEKLAAIVKPDISLISVGKNSYGHPHRNAFRVWNAPLIKTTQKCGDIKIGENKYVTQKRC